MLAKAIPTVVDQVYLLRLYLLWSRLRASTSRQDKTLQLTSHILYFTSCTDQVVKTLGAGADAAKPLLEKGIKEATPYAESAGKEAAQVASKVARDGLRNVLSFLDDFVND